MAATVKKSEQHCYFVFSPKWFKSTGHQFNTHAVSSKNSSIVQNSGLHVTLKSNSTQSRARTWCSEHQHLFLCGPVRKSKLCCGCEKQPNLACRTLSQQTLACFASRAVTQARRHVHTPLFVFAAARLCFKFNIIRALASYHELSAGSWQKFSISKHFKWVQLTNITTNVDIAKQRWDIWTWDKTSVFAWRIYRCSPLSNSRK